MILSNPWLLVIGPMVALLVVVGLVRLASRQRRLAEFLGGPRATWRMDRAELHRIPTGRIVLLSLAALSLAAAAADPRWNEGDEASPGDPGGIEVREESDGGLVVADPAAGDRVVAAAADSAASGTILALDISASMQADDVEPTRLGRAAEIAGELLESLEGTRVGLVLFSGTPYTLAPPTADHGVLEYLLDGITPELVNIYDPGSLPSAALREAISHLATEDSAGMTGLEDQALPSGPSGARTIVVIGDGEAGEPVASVREAATAAAEAGIRIHAIGVGSPEGGRLVLPAGYTRKGADGSGPRGPTVSRLEEGTLREMATTGGGLYAHADDPAALARIHRVLGDAGAESSPEPEGPLWTRIDPGAALVGLALLLLVAEGLSGTGLLASRGSMRTPRPNRGNRAVRLGRTV